MKTVVKITPEDYPDLLAAVEEGVSQRELARRYGCAASLIARHVAKARRLRELDVLEEEVAADPGVRSTEGSMCEILEARIRDPRTPARELASLVNARARLRKDDERAESGASTFPFRVGTLILEPGRPEPGSKRERRFHLMLRERGRITHVPSRDETLTAGDAAYYMLCCLQSELSLPLEVLGLTREGIDATKARLGY